VADPLHFWVNDIGMVFFLALAAKEVFEATLPGGALASRRQAVSALAAAVGGMAAPAAIYAVLVAMLGPSDLLRGWAIPCATDIAFSAMVARAIFPGGHPAIPFLLLLAIADDALGLAILALFYPSGTLSLTALTGMMTAALVVALWLRRRQTGSFCPMCSARECCHGRRCTGVVFTRRWRWFRLCPSSPTATATSQYSTREKNIRRTR
jgi:NhaA family Na+:H+ antiporter